MSVKRVTRISILVFLACFTLVFPVFAGIFDMILGPQGPKQRKDKAIVYGIVVAAPAGGGNPKAVPGAQVLLKGTKGSATVQTDKDGTFKFQGIPAGEYIVTAEKPGVGTGSMKFYVSTNENKRLDPLQLAMGGTLLVNEDGVLLPDSAYVIFDGSSNPVGPDDIANIVGPPSDMDRFMPPAGVSESSESKKNPVTPSVEHSSAPGSSFSSDNQLMIIDPQGGNRLEPFPMEGKPTWICFNPAGTKLYVASNLNSIQVFDTVRGNTILGSIDLPAPVHDMVISPHGDRIYAICKGNTGIQDIDTGRMKVDSTFTIPLRPDHGEAQPVALALNKEGTKLYVAMTAPDYSEIVAFDTMMRIVLDTKRVVVEPHPVAISLAGNNSSLFVLHNNPDRISVVSLGAVFSVASVFPVAANPSHLAVTHDGSRAYVACAGNNTVAVILATGSVTKSIGVGKEPRHLALTTSGKRLFVGNGADGTVSIIDTAENFVVMKTKPRQGIKPMGIAVKP